MSTPTPRGIPLSVIATWPTAKPTFTPAVNLPNVSACPTCTHAAPGMVHLIRRPTIICGQRSGVWMLVAAPGCTHCDHYRPEFNSADPAALVDRWNDYAKRKAAVIIDRRQMNPTHAAYFLAALTDPKL